VKLKDIKIAVLVKFGFGILLFFVIMLGVISYLQTGKIHQQTEIMYNHPLIVRRALDTLTIDVLNMRMASKDLCFAVTDQEKHDGNQLIALSAANILEQFNLLHEAYLGPSTDVGEAFKAFVRWRTAHEEYYKLVLSKQIPLENDSGASTGKLILLREQFEVSIKKIDNFAKNKSDALFVAANKLYHSLTRKLILLVAIILLLSLTTIYILLRNIHKPLTELTYATQRFQNGNMDARSSYESKNEFGVLSASFNILAENIQANSDKLAYQNHELESQKTELQILSAQLLSAEERERKRIASDIHDSIGQALSAIKFGIENSLTSLSENSTLPAIKSLSSIVPLTQQAIEEVRRISMDLRPSTLDDLGLVATISWFCREFESIYTNIHVEKEIHVKEADIPSSLKTVIYRILQEALNNAAKHSQTDIIHLHLMRNKADLELMIEDTGLGFEMDKVQSMNPDKRGIGLTSMKERALQSGGTFNIKSSTGIGTSLFVSWPIKVNGIDQE
jgi:signal transduction histidine kinase